MGTKFNIKTLVEFLNIAPQIRNELMGLFDYFLYAVPDTVG